MTSTISTQPSLELTVGEGNRSRWTHPDHRRHGWHNLYRIARYCSSFRAAEVMILEKRADLRIAEMDAVRQLTALPWFSGMVVIRGPHVLFERYAPDFGPNCPHSIQSITKTFMNLIVGHLVDLDILDLSRPVRYYLPEIGSGYAEATLQQVLNMDVVNDYSEDYSDPNASYYRHEEAMGWRIPRDPAHEETQRGFIARIASSDTTNHSGKVQYKDANADVLGWVAERASGRPLRAFLADIVDAAGLEGALHITTDRDGFPTMDGGACTTARDLARYLSIFVRRGRGIVGQTVGSSAFIDRTLASGIPWPSPLEPIRYSNHTMVSGRMLGHGGWGGQYALANLDTGIVGVLFSVIEDFTASNLHYLRSVSNMLESVVSAPG